MRKLIIVLSMGLILFTGCSIKELDEKEFKNNIDVLLKEDINTFNVSYNGYKFYIPSGLKFEEKVDNNIVLNDEFNNKYYLYIDLVGYYHKNKYDYKVNKDAYYSAVLNYNNKQGYIEINELDNSYFVTFVFNYCKIESFINKDNLVDSINNMCYILRSFSYNKTVLESLVGENVLNYKEEPFKLFEEEKAEDFLDVVSKYDPGYKKARDQEKLEINEE